MATVEAMQLFVNFDTLYC